LEVVTDEGAFAIEARKPRAVLALLLLHANEIVPAERLIEHLWGGDPPGSAAKALQTYVSQLRKALGPERIVTRAPGYLVSVASGELDVERFTNLRTSEPDAALALWRGAPLADFEYDAWAQPEIARLAEARLETVEERIERELAADRHQGLVAELEALVQAHPYRERLRAQLMLALYRSGRQVEALAAYRDGREFFVSELGIDPSPELQRLEQRIVAHDASLDARPAPERASARPRPATVRTDTLLRKRLTILFCDLVGSTALGEQLDAERLRRLMSRYFEAARTVLERHGGVVEKFIGDAVVAVFGLPQLHEDDALRAVRAALELRAALAAFDGELGEDGHAGISVRIGISSGEVVAGVAESLVTGDAVNVAARLEQVAAAGEILLAAPTRRLLRDRVLVEAVGPLELKGKGAPVEAFRLVDLLPDIGDLGARRTPFVGRAQELERLAAAYDAARDERGCKLVAVVGVAGIGKSRLVSEFLAALEPEARLLSGRCLAYGSGITYWPLREAVRQLTGEESRAELERLLADEPGAATAIAAAIGLERGTPQSSEVSWAVGRLLEQASAERPLVLVFEDVHWAEPVLLDLIDYLHAFVRTGAVLVVTTGRPELLELRPSWQQLALTLAPLAPAEAEELADLVTDGDALARTRAVQIAEGNPLFIEQLLAAGPDEDDVPSTIQALLAARIDSLSPSERAVALAAAVEGRQFHRRAVTALAPEELRGDVTSHLLALVRKDIVRPDESVFRGDDGFSFTHVLVRDAAYAAASKELRAELHERFAAWLEAALGERAGGLEEIVGYHLSAAHGLRVELGFRDVHTDHLGSRAATLLGDAGRLALGRGDLNAARDLLDRAVTAAPAGDPELGRYRLDLGETLLYAGDMPRAGQLADSARADAETAGDDAARVRADVVLTYVRSHTGEPTADEWRLVAERAIAVLAPLEDHYWLARSWQLLRQASQADAQTGRIAEAAGQMSRHARLAGDRRLESEAIQYLPYCWAEGPTPLETALDRCAALRARAETREREALIDKGYALALAMAGRIDEAHARMDGMRSFMRELGNELIAAVAGSFAGLIELWAGDLAAADTVLSQSCADLRAMGDHAFLCTQLAQLAQVRVRRGRLDDADELARESRKLGGTYDLTNEVWWRMALTEVLSARGEHDDAEQLAHEAIATAGQTDMTYLTGLARLTLAQALHAAGRHDEARAAGTQARRIFEDKGAVALVSASLQLAGDATPV
jgi:class 3 adenylate cyclase